MDVEHNRLGELLDNTDAAFRRLMEDPESTELTNEYEHAKSALDHYLSSVRDSLRKRFKDN